MLSVTFVLFFVFFCLCMKYLGGTAERMILNGKVKGQDHQGQKTCSTLPSPPAATEWNARAANNVTRQQTGQFRCCRGTGDVGGLRAVCVCKTCFVKHL